MKRTGIAMATGIVTLVTFSSGPALADDSESGSLRCPAGQTVVITERTSAGVTTVSYGDVVRRIDKNGWSTTTHRTGLRSTSWRVATTGEMDHATTGAACRRS
jgi:hypothetical protein